MTTTYVLTALPHSVDPAEDFHVSVVVSPRLSPDGTLADFPVFAEWTDQLATAAVSVVDHTNVAFTTTQVAPSHAADWNVVFPPETPVQAFVPQTFAGRNWFSYSASRMDVLAKAVHLLSLAADPIDPPLPSTSPLAVAFERQLSQWRDDFGKMHEDRLTRLPRRVDQLERVAETRRADGGARRPAPRASLLRTTRVGAARVQDATGPGSVEPSPEIARTRLPPTRCPPWGPLPPAPRPRSGDRLARHRTRPSGPGAVG